MFDHMLDSGPESRGKSWSALLLSAAVHLPVLGSIAGASYLVLDAIEPPEPPIAFTSFRLAVPPPPARPPAPAASTSAEARPQAEPEDLTQPVDVPEELPAAPEPIPSDVVGPRGDADGVPGGSPDGVPGGSPDGVPGGTPDGVPGGTGDAPGGPSTSPREEPRILTVEMVQPQLVHRVHPRYPEFARKSRLEGRVILRAVIATSGGVQEVEVLRATSPLFVGAAVEAVRQWRYTPALADGRPVTVYFTVIVDFELE